MRFLCQPLGWVDIQWSLWFSLRIGWRIVYQ
jgi:hypothetical protein